MYKTLIIIAALLAITAVSVLAMAAAKPNEFRVERSTTIQASPERIQPLLVDLHRFSEWSPYEKLDPNMKRIYSGPPSGPGAKYAWESEGDAGYGSMTIQSVTPDCVTLDLEFTKPFTCNNVVEFKLAPEADATQLTWSMHGPAPFVSKVMQVFCNMDKMVGQDFETGLATLKSQVEKQ